MRPLGKFMFINTATIQNMTNTFQNMFPWTHEKNTKNYTGFPVKIQFNINWILNIAV